MTLNYCLGLLLFSVDGTERINLLRRKKKFAKLLQTLRPKAPEAEAGKEIECNFITFFVCAFC